MHSIIRFSPRGGGKAEKENRRKRKEKGTRNLFGDVEWNMMKKRAMKEEIREYGNGKVRRESGKGKDKEIEGPVIISNRLGENS
jgi:hypothetical protein